MKFLSFKSVVATGALSVAGLGLIGMGTHATFNVDPSANQVISSGTLAVVASSPSDPTCLTYLANCPNITLTSSANNGSSFTTGPEELVLTNVGTLPAFYTTLGITNAYGPLEMDQRVIVEFAFVGRRGEHADQRVLPVLDGLE